MKIRRIILFTAVLFVRPLFAAAGSVPAHPPLLAPGTTAPDFSAVGADNRPVKLSRFAGSYVLVDFWATWCAPCRTTMPHFESLHKKLRSQGLVMIGVCIWDDRPNFVAWLKKPDVETTYL